MAGGETFAVETGGSELDIRARRWNDTFKQIGDMLTANRLEPTPSNYDLCHRYVGGDDQELVRRVDDAIALHGHLSPTMAATILASRSVELTAHELGRMADEAQNRLQEITEIVDRSGNDARDYEAALESNVSQLISNSSPGALAGLVDITRAMIERTRVASNDLKRNGQEIVKLRESLAEARRNADTDPLTGLPNRRALDVRLRAACEIARASRLPLSLAICDIDEFKSVNDLHGHHIGDEVIKFIATALTRDDAEKLFVARYGGEEFVMLFEGIDAEDAAAEIDRIRRDVSLREFKVTTTGKQLGRLTFSAGIAAFQTRKGPSGLLRSADAALYRAKEEGRNRVCIAE